MIAAFLVVHRAADYRLRQLALVRSRRAMNVGTKTVRAAKVVVIA